MVPLELINIFLRLQVVETRKEGLLALAAYAHCRAVSLFGKDREIGVFLPAHGQPQTMRHGASWQRFIEGCGKHGFMSGALPGMDGTDVPAFCIVDTFKSAALVFTGAEPAPENREHMRVLLPFIGAQLVAERASQSAAGRAESAREASRRASMLNAALDSNRRELQAAFERTEKELIFRRSAEKKLQEADRRKDEFLATLAHELRNPLAPIRQAAQIAKSASATPAQLRWSHDVIDRQAGHMALLLDDLLDVSRITRGQLQLRKSRVELAAVIDTAIETAKPVIDARAHELSVRLPELPVQLEADAMRLAQVISNLLTNAAKYTDRSGSISLVAQVKGAAVVISVRDSGMGIDPGMLSRLFVMFSQAEEALERAQGGLGIGLALVKGLVELHGGEVEARSEGLGQGSEFRVTLPLAGQAQQQEDSAIQAWSASCAGSARQVLIADDNQDAADSLKLLLEFEGHDVRCAYDGQLALEAARAQPPHVMIVDIGMPRLNGYELARALRSQPWGKGIVLIALTGWGQLKDRALATEAGFDHHLTKPVNIEAVQGLLRELK